MKRLPLIASIILFVMLSLSVTYWVMKLIKPEIRKFRPPQINRPMADVESVAAIFGGVMVVDVNYQLKGIIQANPMNQSVAVISIDGRPPKAYVIHSEVNSGSSLNEVYSRYVLLKEGGATKRIELPQDSHSGQITLVAKSPRGQENKAANRQANEQANRQMNNQPNNPNPSGIPVNRPAFRPPPLPMNAVPPGFVPDPSKALQNPANPAQQNFHPDNIPARSDDRP